MCKRIWILAVLASTACAPLAANGLHEQTATREVTTRDNRTGKTETFTCVTVCVAGCHTTCKVH